MVTSNDNLFIDVKDGSPSGDAEPLSDYLRRIRRMLGFSLRAVEAATEKSVTNGYLSQIESGDVSRPSPNILWHLAAVYGLDYADLLARAGHRVPATAANVGARPDTVAGVPLRALEELDEQDQNLLREYLAFLRSRKKDRP